MYKQYIFYKIKMDITYLIFLSLSLVIASIGIMFRMDSIQALIISFIMLVVAGSIIKTSGD